MKGRVGSEEELQCALGSCFSEERGFLACHTVPKAIPPFTGKILILLVLFFFFSLPRQLIFPVRDALHTNQGGTTKKKIVLKAIAQINSDHWGIPAYIFSSFIYFFLSSVQVTYFLAILYSLKCLSHQTSHLLVFCITPCQCVWIKGRKC